MTKAAPNYMPLARQANGILLAALCPGARAVGSLAAARRLARSGRVPILLASRIVDRAPRLERSFRLTSDSIAAFLAGRAGAPRLLLLKSVARPRGPLRARSAVRAMARRGLVDPLFPVTIPDRVEVIVLDGRHPRALDGLLREAPRRAAPRRRRAARA